MRTKPAKKRGLKCLSLSLKLGIVGCSEVYKGQQTADGLMIEPPIEEIIRTIVEAVRPRRIIVFGSRARVDSRSDSDLDLMVELETDDPPAQRVRAIDALFGLRRWAMDLVVYTPQEVRKQRQYRNSLIRVIESEGKVLYEQPR